MLKLQNYKYGISNVDLKTIANKLGIKLNGIYMKDQLTISNTYTGAYIVNLQNSDHSGSHWVSFIKVDDDITFYFDSFGQTVPDTLRKLFNNENLDDKVYYNLIQIQDYHSTLCGLYCILYLYVMKNSKVNVFKRLKEYLNLFNTEKKCLKDNDVILIDYLNCLLD